MESRELLSTVTVRSGRPLEFLDGDGREQSVLVRGGNAVVRLTDLPGGRHAIESIDLRVAGRRAANLEVSTSVPVVRGRTLGRVWVDGDLGSLQANTLRRDVVVTGDLGRLTVRAAVTGTLSVAGDVAQIDAARISGDLYIEGDLAGLRAQELSGDLIVENDLVGAVEIAGDAKAIYVGLAFQDGGDEGTPTGGRLKGELHVGGDLAYLIAVAIDGTLAVGGDLGGVEADSQTADSIIDVAGAIGDLVFGGDVAGAVRADSITALSTGGCVTGEVVGIAPEAIDQVCPLPDDPTGDDPVDDGAGATDDPPVSDGGTGSGSGETQPGDDSIVSQPGDSAPVLPGVFHPQFYSADSPFNQRIAADAAIDPNSAMLIESVLRAQREQGVVLVKDNWTVPIYYADADTPRYDVQLTAGWAPVRVLHNVPIPGVAQPDAEDDGHVVVVDLTNGLEYDFWQARRSGGLWSASWGNVTSIYGNGVFPFGLSARGSGFAIVGGLIWPDELARRRIDHALVFSYAYPKSGGPVFPATESDGESNRPDAIPEGARLQLDPTFDLDALDLTPYERTIARALQEYGAILVDHSGGGISFYAVHEQSFPGDVYNGLLPDERYILLDGLPLDRLRVLRMSPQNPDPDLRVVPPQPGPAVSV